MNFTNMYFISFWFIILSVLECNSILFSKIKVSVIDVK